MSHEVFVNTHQRHAEAESRQRIPLDLPDELSEDLRLIEESVLGEI